jgi:outer membrane protein assembly factor BamB
MPHRNRPFSLVVIAFILAPISILAGDWTEFRGGNDAGQAEASDLPVMWSETKNIQWRTELPGLGWSSAVTSDGFVFLTAAVPVEDSTEQDLVVIAMDEKTGDIAWQTTALKQAAPAPKIHNKNSHASPTPVIVGDRIVVHFGHQGTACLDLRGKVIWRNRELKYPPVHGNGGSPVVVDGKVIFSCDAASDPFIAALSLDDGDLLWRTARSIDAERKFSFSTPVVIEWKGQTQIVTAASDGVFAYGLDGQELWRVRYSGYSVVPKPVFRNGFVYVCTGFNQPSLLAIRPGGKGDSTDTHLEWSIKGQVPHTPSLLVTQDLLFMVSDGGIASCLEAQTGDEIWVERLKGRGFSASPILADGKIYFTSEDGVTTVIKESRNFEQLGVNTIKEKTLASIGVVDNSLLLRTEAALYRISK